VIRTGFYAKTGYAINCLRMVKVCEMDFEMGLREFCLQVKVVGASQRHFSLIE
jgi:hypothetical protein